MRLWEVLSLQRANESGREDLKEPGARASVEIRRDFSPMVKALLTDSDRFGGDGLAVSRVSDAPERDARTDDDCDVELTEALADEMLAIDRGRMDQVREVLRAVRSAVACGEVYARAE